MADKPRLTSEKSMTFDDFTDYLFVLTQTAWGKDWGTFTSTKPTITESKDVTFPQIVYSLEEMIPGVIGQTGTREIKPRIREIKDPEEGTEDFIRIKAQRFDCIVAFYLYGKTNPEVDELTDSFMSLMTTYTGYLMENGAGQIIFQKRENRNAKENIKDVIASRGLIYYVRLEKQDIEYVSAIKEISVKADMMYSNLEKSKLLPSQRKLQYED